MGNKELTLYRKNSMGIGLWKIWSHDDMIYYDHALVEGGSWVAHELKVELNQSGRTMEEQVALEIRSRVSRMMDKGYKATREEALAGATNQLNLINPMLAQSFRASSAKPFVRAHMQPKLNGHRAMITNLEGNIIAYTRKGKLITTVNHILSDFRWLQEGQTVDGELYIHGVPLQRLSSLIKRGQAESSGLKFWWYDFNSPLPYEQRHAKMMTAFGLKQMEHVVLTPTHLVRTLDEVWLKFHEFRTAKYEGGMLRLSIAGYESNTRAAQLLKVKARDDCEVTVLGATPSKDGWAVLQVQYIGSPSDDPDTSPKDGVIFDITAPGTVPQKTEILQNIQNYIGRRLKIEYAELTSSGVPFHAVAMEWESNI